jgi:predicted PurR-regulated permease PerM
LGRAFDVINLNLNTSTRWGLNALILLGMIMALYLGRSILIPTTLALLLAAMLWPAVNHLHSTGWLKLPWAMACLTVVGGLFLIALLVASGFGLGISKLIIDISSREKQVEVYRKFRDKLERMSPVPLDDHYFNEDPEVSSVFRSIKGSLNPDNPTFNEITRAILGTSKDFLWESILIMFLLLFLLLEGRMLTRRVVEIFGPSEMAQSKAVAALEDMATQIRAYLVWRTIINFSLALVLGVIYYFLGLSQPWTWALLTAILWYVPYLGPILAGVPPLLDAFISCDSPWIALGLAIFYTAFVTIEGYFIVPVVMGRSMELNATTVMLACLFWELVWGTAGLFLAMPLMAGVKTVCAHVPDWQPWANLMDTRDTPPAPSISEYAKAIEGLMDDTQIMTAAELKAEIAAREAAKSVSGIKREEKRV